jgi:hypothetical protein
MTSSNDEELGTAVDHQQPEPPRFEELTLSPKLNPRWAPSLPQLLTVALCCVVFVLLNYLPLRAPDLWGAVAYGQWILDHRALPTNDPFMPLAEGMRVVDTDWLSQVILGLAQRWADGEGLSNLFSVMALLALLLLARTYYLQGGRSWGAVLTTLLVPLITWNRFSTLRPELMALVCLASLLWLIVSSQATSSHGAERPASFDGAAWRLWLGVPLLFVVWANLHSSFVYGLAVLGCYGLGAAIEIAWRTRSVRAVAADRTCRRWLYLCELAVAATLLNPYGMDLLLHLIWFADGQNLQEIVDWQPLALLQVGGREFALSIVALMLVLRHSRERFSVAHGLLLALFAVAAIAQQRMLLWYAVIFGLVLAPHVAELCGRLGEAWTERFPRPSAVTAEEFDPTQPPPGRSWKYLLVGVLLVWIAFALTGLSRPLLGGKSRTPQQLFGSSAPLGLLNYLRENPPSGVSFTPHWRSDWLVTNGLPVLQPFMTSQVQFAPRQVWRDYRRVYTSGADWQSILDRYQVRTLIVEKDEQRALSALARTSSEWTVRYEDDKVVAFGRQLPTAGGSVGPGDNETSPSGERPQP